MAKTIGKLRQQVAKLRELDAPSDVTRATKNFVKKHVYVVHPDANENGDDVFKAKNVKKSKRFPDHGYEPGQDKDVYEDIDTFLEGKYKDIDTERKEKARRDRVNDSVTMKKGRTRGEDLLGDHRASRRFEGQRLKDRMRHEETEIDEVFGLSKKEKAKKAAKDFMNSPRSPWKKADDAMKSTSSHRYWGKTKTEGFNEGTDSDDVEDRNNEHHYLHNMIQDNIDHIHKTLSKHVDLMDNMNDRHHEAHFHKLSRLNDKLTDLADKISKVHENARSAMGMNPKTPTRGISDMAGKPMVGAAFPHSEGAEFEHFEALSEKDQTVLVDTYNSLTEENQERFLEMIETPEGVDQLLDFAITNKGFN